MFVDRFVLVIAAFLLLAGLGASPAAASIVTVPDDFSTAQAAINSGADTVQVREGVYPENLLIERHMVFRGLGPGSRPRFLGLEIRHTNLEYPHGLVVTGIDFTGVIAHRMLVSNHSVFIRFEDCALGSGFAQVASYGDPLGIGLLAFVRCRIAGSSSARLGYLYMEADTVAGTMSWQTEEAEIRDCRFTGGTGTAVNLFSLHGIRILRNHIERYPAGLVLRSENGGMLIDGNTIRACGAAIDIREAGWNAEILYNEIADCGTGIYTSIWERVVLRGNRILRCSGSGFLAQWAEDVIVERNVVGGCGGAGIRIEWYSDAYGGGRLRSNTVFNNGGSGFELIPPTTTWSAVLVQNNIGYGNRGRGLWSANGMVQHGCNDWYGNQAGSVGGVAPDTTDVGVDPLFCGAGLSDVRLHAMSPLTGAAGCGPIGALGAGCGAMVETMAVESKARGPVVRWRFGEVAPLHCWLERRVGETGAWARVTGEPGTDGASYSQSDEDVELDITYWYRVGWLEAGILEYLFSPPVPHTVDRLPAVSRVFPNPSAGPLTIEWTLLDPAEMEVCVFDLAGRRVATLAEARFERGRSTVRWDGKRTGGELAPAGWYVLRVRGGTIDAAHRLLLLR